MSFSRAAVVSSLYQISWGRWKVLFCVHQHDVLDHVLYHLNVSHSLALFDRMADLYGVSIFP